MDGPPGRQRTFILANVLEGEGQAGVLALDDTDLAESAFADDPQKSKMVEIDCRLVSTMFARLTSSPSTTLPSSVKTTGFP
jgi:hypothetical protein